MEMDAHTRHNQLEKGLYLPNFEFYPYTQEENISVFESLFPRSRGIRKRGKDEIQNIPKTDEEKRHDKKVTQWLLENSLYDKFNNELKLTS